MVTKTRRAQRLADKDDAAKVSAGSALVDRRFASPSVVGDVTSSENEGSVSAKGHNSAADHLGSPTEKSGAAPLGNDVAHIINRQSADNPKWNKEAPSNQSASDADEEGAVGVPPSQEEPNLETDEQGTETPAAPQAPSPKARPVPRKAATSGVIYLSRIPPGMDVGALRSLLSRTGRLGRVWLRPESAEARAERRALGSGRRRGEFMDGWVEFARRRDAKRAVALLNGRAMSGATRRGRWADDLWCMRLLRGFTWADLVEETCAGARERTLRVKAEVAAARREKAFVEERVAMAGRMRRAEAKEDEAEVGVEGAGEGKGRERVKMRSFRQKRVVGEAEWEEDADERRAREAMERVDGEGEGKGKGKGIGQELDAELVGMLFKKKRRTMEK